MALVDRRLNKVVIQIASVSGGSITNAYVAQRCAFEELAPGELDDIVRDLVSAVTSRGVVTKTWIVILLGLPALVAAAIGTLVTLVAATGFAVAAALVAFLGSLMFAGLVVEWLLDRRYFRLAKPGSGHSRRASLGSLAERKVDHLFCMTDLVLGLPVYLSGQQGGMLYRRLGTERKWGSPGTPESGDYGFHTWSASNRTIAETVRASAGFPGIPPRRYRMVRDPKVPGSLAAPTVAFLADGGLWNNLGTQAQREDGFLASYAGRGADGVLRPFGRSPESMPVLAINGSAPLKPSHPGVYRIPGLAMAAAMLAITRILTANTVVPRVDSMRASFNRRQWTGSRPELVDPLDLVVDLSEVNVSKLFYGAYARGEEEIRKSDPIVKGWERDLVDRARETLKSSGKSAGSDLDYLLGAPEPQGSPSAAGFADLDQWRYLTNSTAWQRALACHGPGPLSVPTTLDRIDPEMARRLIARCYLNTYLASMYLSPLNQDDLVYLGRLPERLASLTNRTG
jgi:hypothetical protein